MTTSASLSTIEINGVTYVPASSLPSSSSSLPSGNRHVVVIDRGWIFAGDLTTDEVTKEITLSNALHVFRWESIGFSGVIENPKSDKVTLKVMSQPVKVPSGSVIFTVPVPANWGL